LFVVICIIHFHRDISLSDVLYRALSLAFMLFVGIHNPLHQNMPHHVRSSQMTKSNPIHMAQNFLGNS
jgi:hypothetical protein